MIPEVPVAGKAISLNASIATIIGAEEGFVAVSMHSVGLALMAEETGRGREMEVLASDDLASVWLQM